MSLSAVRYLLPGLVAGLAAFAFSRTMVAPLIGASVDYEAEREHAEAQLAGSHEHGRELFTRSVQENVGAATGIVVFSITMGVLFTVAYTVLLAVLHRRGYRPDPTGLAFLLAAGMFVAIALMPSLKYPANPPGIGLEDTMAERSSAFLLLLAISVLSAGAAVAAGLAGARRSGIWAASGVAISGYLAVMVCVMALLPSFREIPRPLAGPDGTVLDGFPAELLADFRVYSLINQAVMWLAIGATFGGLAALQRFVIRRDREGVR